MDYSWLSIIPPVLAVLLAFLTREPVISLAFACLVGVLLSGSGLGGFPQLLVRALGNRDFIWICMVELLIGALVAFYQRSGAVEMFSKKVSFWRKSAVHTQLLGWGLGMFIFFSDYFSPLFVGPVMRKLTDRARVSREKLAYICDSTSAPMSVLAPITGWTVYISGLLAGLDSIEGKRVAMSLFIRSIPFNFYAILTVLMVGMIAIRWIPEFGPMRHAEQRALRKGQAVRPGSLSLMSSELTQLQPSKSGRRSIWLNFFLPVAIVIAWNTTTFITRGQAQVLESFMAAVCVLGLIMLIQGVETLSGLMKCFLAGIKGVMPAVLILAFAYAINTLSKEMGTAQFVVQATEGWFRPFLLPGLAFVISAFISFSTGTSWGTYAIMMPMAVPMAVSFSPGVSSPLVLATIAAVAGGGVFGDHCSPLSDTTVLSSLGSACDHMDHVKTQIPYALTVAGIAFIFYIFIGVIA
ncbi:MAG: Na+/H+ antiporter NhaC family protein [Candidatus Aminicenantales bacterium]